jgi:hypothetical protein
VANFLDERRIVSRRKDDRVVEWEVGDTWPEGRGKRQEARGYSLEAGYRLQARGWRLEARG